MCSLTENHSKIADALSCRHVCLEQVELIVWIDRKNSTDDLYEAQRIWADLGHVISNLLRIATWWEKILQWGHDLGEKDEGLKTNINCTFEEDTFSLHTSYWVLTILSVLMTLLWIAISRNAHKLSVNEKEIFTPLQERKWKQGIWFKARSKRETLGLTWKLHSTEGMKTLSNPFCVIPMVYCCHFRFRWAMNQKTDLPLEKLLLLLLLQL